MTDPAALPEEDDLIKELRAKAWRDCRGNKGKSLSDHVCSKAIAEIIRLKALLSKEPKHD